jgi:protein-disulfide isomerase
MKNENLKPIVSAIILVGIMISGAILLKGSTAPEGKLNKNGISVETKVLAPVGEKDRVLGNPEAKVVFVVYEDFQCPFCGAVSGSNSYPSLLSSLKQKDPNWLPFVPNLIEDYVKKGDVLFVYRDWAFLGSESVKAAEAARCAGDQGKFWEYHDYLYENQKGENEGHFSNDNLKLFAKTLNLDTEVFDKCLDNGKYSEEVNNSRLEGANAGVNGTPKGFILKDGVLIGTVDGAESYTTVKTKIEQALK